MDRRKQRTGKVRPILRETHPSYYAFILDGETMLGEYWESNPRSHCHDMMGHIIEWYYNGIAGIIPEAPGFAKITIRPHLPESMHELEYKNPDDALTIDDYYKTVGYACLYKGLGESVDQIPADELTISIFRESCPREMFKTMKKIGLEIEERYPGICGKGRKDDRAGRQK